MRRITLLAVTLGSMFFVTEPDADACWFRRGGCTPIIYCPPCVPDQWPNDRGQKLEDSGTEGPEPRVRVLLLIVDRDRDNPDPQKRIGSGCQVDYHLVTRLLEAQVGPQQRAKRVDLLESWGELAPDTILGHVRQMKVGPKDTLLCYYSGHGGMSARNEHYLAVPGRTPLPRKTLLDALKGKGAALTVLLTDCCATFPERIPTAAEYGKPLKESEVLRSLLLRHRGTVDINSSSPGEASGASGGGDPFKVTDYNGGYFTRAFYQECTEGPSAEEKSVGWDTFFTRVRDHTNSIWRTRRFGDTQKTQTPYPFTPLSAVKQDDSRAALFSSPANIVVDIPSDAILYIDGARTKQDSAYRTFETPSLPEGESLVYTFRAEIKWNGQTLVETRRVVVGSGRTTHVEFAELIAATKGEESPGGRAGERSVAQGTGNR